MLREPRSAFICLCLVLATASLAAAERTVIEAILIRVNDRIVTITDFRERLSVDLAQPGSPTDREGRMAYARQLFDQIVDELVLLERADEKQIVVDDEALDQIVAGIREEQDLQDDATFEEALRQVGLDEQRLREQLRRQSTVQRAAQSEVRQPEITEEEVRRRYQRQVDDFATPAQVELEQLVFPVAEDGSDRAAVRERVEGMLDRVAAGADLRAEATLAGVEVQELGAIPVDDLRDDLRAELDPLDEGGLTAPLESPVGFQVIHLVRRIPAGHRPFEEVKDQVRMSLVQEAYESQTKGVVERLREEYLVEVHRDRFEQILEAWAGS